MSVYEKCFSYAFEKEDRLCDSTKEKQLTLKSYINFRNFKYLIKPKDRVSAFKHDTLGNALLLLKVFVWTFEIFKGVNLMP